MLIPSLQPQAIPSTLSSCLSSCCNNTIPTITIIVFIDIINIINHIDHDITINEICITSSIALPSTTASSAVVFMALFVNSNIFYTSRWSSHPLLPTLSFHFLCRTPRAAAVLHRLAIHHFLALHTPLHETNCAAFKSHTNTEITDT